MDPENGTGVGTGIGAPGVNASRRKSSGRRRSTVAHIPQEVVDHTQLNDADRRLAEMGYVQVFHLFHTLSYPLSHRTENISRHPHKIYISWYGKAYIANRVPIGL